ncbi:iron-sulfur cluster carrier protein ApbC [Alishewanella tabrizica]|uniref:Iron-sulfur cluster carrier protein n=1 Tax=Alishewanella tabrizica TaxID=671278 RepID=A0ABQ2WJ81_9ALTE|nr:iron-sulfur cluster carrier protein ApbC [Alishewanella tabrizica]GGW58228.1 iron-sulfur cluster carrier protein [Alishewanella tabrizica]
MFNWLKKSAATIAQRDKVLQQAPSAAHTELSAITSSAFGEPVAGGASVEKQTVLDSITACCENIRLKPPAFKSIQCVVLIASGKGGVGKSTTAANLAMALAAKGVRTGLLDADIYGPSVPTLFGLQGHKVTSPDNKLMLPLRQHRVVLQSIGFLVDPEQASVWRGPMASQALLQLINETVWPDLDVLLIDMPPGTGDIQLTLSQKLPVTGAIVVTTPQDLALADAKKAITMFQQVNIPLLGLVENMSFYVCPSCGAQDDVFGTAGGLHLAERYHVPVLGQLPLQSAIRLQADSGVALDKGDEAMNTLYQTISLALLQRLSGDVPEHTSVEIMITDD